MDLLETCILKGETDYALNRLEADSFDREEINPALIAAALTGNQKMLRILIEAGTDRDTINRALAITAAEGETAYRLRDELCKKTGVASFVVSQQKNNARKNGDYIECTKILLSSGAEVSDNEHLALKHAALRYRIKSVQVLLEHGTDIGQAPLKDFFKFDSFEKSMQLPEKVELLKVLLDAGISVNSDRGETLSQAVLHAYDDFVYLLLEAGAELNNPFGQCSLIYAAENGNVEIVKMLLERGADINDEDLLYAASFNGHNEVLKFLLEKGAGSDYPEYVDQALEGAAEAGKLSTVKLLLKAGANPNANLAINLASENDHSKIADLLRKTIKQR